MKTYKDEHIIRDLPIDDDREWVPADVAQELYEAIEILYTLGLNDEQELIVDKALAAADGEEL